MKKYCAIFILILCCHTAYSQTNLENTSMMTQSTNSIHPQLDENLIVILDFKPKKVPKLISRMSTDILREKMINTNYYRLMKRKEIKQILKEYNISISGCSNTQCAVKAGTVLNAGKVIIGAVWLAGKKYIVNTKVINIKKEKIVFYAKTSFYSESKMDKAIKELAKKLSRRITGRDIQISSRNTDSTNSKYPDPDTDIMVTNEVVYQTNIGGTPNTSRWNNMGFFWLQPEEPFVDEFSAGSKGNGEYYYRLPFNSWNDNLYLSFTFDWPLDFLDFLKPRAGWGIELNFSGSGNGKDTKKVEPNTDLGQAVHSPNFTIYNFHKFPIMGIFRIQPISIWRIGIYAGIGAGAYVYFATYNELIGEEKSSIEQQFEKTFVKGDWIVKLFCGISVNTIEQFQTIFVEINYKYANNPILTNDFFQSEDRETGEVTGYIRHISFQVSGLSFGFGFRFQ